MDKDDMTDLHRQKVMQQFSKQLGILTHVWESYNFESVLLTELDKLGSLLARYAQSKNTTVKTSSDIFRTRLESAMEQEVTTLQSLYESESELNQLYGKWKGRRDSLSNSTLGIHVTQVFEEDRGLKMALLHYYQSCFRVAEMHKICRKEHLERILQQALLPEDIPFNLETDFDDLFSLLDKGTLPEAYNFLLTV